MQLLNSYLGYVMIAIIIIAGIGIKLLKTYKIIKLIRVLFIFYIIWLLFVQVFVLSEFHAKIPENKEIDYLIVLGAGLKGDKVSYTLSHRLDAALNYANNHEKTKVIVSGGQGADEWISEGEAMAKYLVCHGLAKGRILIEDKSTSTKENIKYSLKVIEGLEIDVNSVNFAIVTSNFHMYRAKYIARNFLKDIEGISAYSSNKFLLNYMLREALAISNEWRKIL